MWREIQKLTSSECYLKSSMGFKFFLIFRIASAAADGEVRLWDLSRQRCVNIYKGHEGRYCRGIVFTPNGENIVSVGDDKRIQTWATEESDEIDADVVIVKKPIDSVNSKNMLTGITYHRYEDKYATCGDVTQLWDASTNHPLKELNWGVDTVHTIKFNQVQIIPA
jgi:WD repeat and SOF domain-containing protein 1